MRWGDAGPALTLVGKGVCFDTGGSGHQAASGMQLMKKDMGGAATVMGLAHMIMALGLQLRLRVLVPAVENASAAMRCGPRTFCVSRKGLTVEVNDTDAEGRLVLGDALAYACEEPADLVVSMATLTGAARVAVGPDLAPYYCDDAGVVAALEAGAVAGFDPVWRLPFHDAYEQVIEPGIADLDNAPGYGFAGSVTAALFLRRFVEGPRYLHFDIYGHTPSDLPARPKGGVGAGGAGGAGGAAGGVGAVSDPAAKDRRLWPATDRVAHVSLRGLVGRDRWTEGEAAQVALPLVDLLRAPGGARERQLVLGEGFTVVDREGGHAFGFARKDGYCGWLPEAALTAEVQATHWVASVGHASVPRAAVVFARDRGAADGGAVAGAGAGRQVGRYECGVRACVAPSGRGGLVDRSGDGGRGVFGHALSLGWQQPGGD